MKVSELRNLSEKLNDKIACDHSALLHKQKLGFTFNEVYNQRPYIFDSTVMDAIKEANDILTADDNVRLPIWISQDTFDSFIAKINLTCR